MHWKTMKSTEVKIEDFHWLLDELDRVWFHDNALSFHSEDLIQFLHRSFSWPTMCSHGEEERRDLHKSPPSKNDDEADIDMVRSLRETGKILSAGDIQRAPLKRFAKSDCVNMLGFEDYTSESTASPDCVSEEGSHGDQDVILEEEVRRLETIPSASALLTTTDTLPMIPRPPRRRRQRRKKTRSLSELEFDELRGFRDLGFKLTNEDLTPRVVSLVPALDKYIQQKDPVHKERIYPSHAWNIRRPDSPLLNLRMPDNNKKDVDMKEHLKFWARTVASTVRQEC